MSTPNSSPALARRLGTGDAVMIGLGSMIGAGIFAAFAPAAAAAGSGLLIGLALAALIAYCNATSSAQLAAQYPTSGGTYVYGRERLGAWPGFVAGWGFVIGKTASCAAMAMTFAAYAVPESWQRPAAVAAVLALAAINTRGVTRTAAATRVIVTVVLLVLAMVVLAGLTSGAPALDGVVSLRMGDGGWMAGGWYGVLQSAGLLFFAFAGYARIATMGEEVREPRRTIPRAILTALGLALAVYVLIAVALLVTVGAAGVAASPTPLAEVLRVRGWEWGVPLVRIGAAAAALGALLALIAGIGRTSLAMARQGDLPRWLATVHPRHQVPHRAEIALALVVSALVLTVDLREAIGFSSVGVLLYYLIANLAALTQEAPDRLYAKGWQVLGAIGCVVLVATLPPVSIAAAAVMFALGVGYRLLRLRRAR
ncbi:APC family permease [Brachybacterium squillarum]|uniref:APC family permease n=1 Tax=Brachybacterium squillarum TaxID=661979 RepID=UPI0002629E43|nr:APC family permease [Brachybacterium squillarum]